MIYYKAMSRDLKCRDQQFHEGGVYELPGPSRLCEYGFHFCKALVLTLEYYPVESCITENRYAEIDVLGDLNWEDVIKHKGVSNKIRIARIIPDDEVLTFVDNNSNSGNSNSGYGNSGNRNSGNRNSGNRNSGDWNSGNRNSGDWNSGSWNSGSWNSGARHAGFFNTGEGEIQAFDEPVTRDVWDKAYKPDFLFFDISDDLGYKGSFKKSWDDADPDDRMRVVELPNFDADIFFEISGIRVDGEGDESK